MKIIKVIVIFISLLITGIVVYLIYLRPMPIPDPASRLKAEQEVYSALFKVAYSPQFSGTFNFAENTTLGEFGIQSINETSNLEHTTLMDFQDINRQSYLLKDYLPVNNEYTLISNAEVEQFYSDWEVFSKKYPNIQAIKSLSRVGFNSSFTQAMVLIGTTVRNFDGPFEFTGDGLIYLFKKVDDKWVLQDQILIWIDG